VNVGGHDFRLQKGSPMINAGTFLTCTGGQGGGKEMPVADVKYFYSGFGISGETGDLIQLAGQNQTATVVDINYTINTLILDQNLTWTDSQEVGLAYLGTAPDLGTFEFDETVLNDIPHSNTHLHNATLLAVYPDPLNGRIQITFALPHTEEVAFRLFTMNGRPVKAYYPDKLAEGTRTITWDINTSGTASIPSGTYILLMQTQISTTQVKLVYVH
jgi:hypothetical protein